MSNRLKKKFFLALILAFSTSIFEAGSLTLLVPLFGSLLGFSTESLTVLSFLKVNSENADIVLLLVPLLFFVKLVIAACKNWVLYGFEWDFRAYLLRKILLGYLKNDYGSIIRNNRSSLAAISFNETLKSASFVRQCLEFLSQSILIVVSAIILAVTSLELLLLASFFSCVYLSLVHFILSPILLNYGKERADIEDSTLRNISDIEVGHLSIRVYRLQESIVKFIHRLSGRLSRVMTISETVKRLPAGVLEFIVSVFLVGLYVANSRLENGFIEPTEMLLFAILGAKLNSSISSISSNYSSLVALYPSFAMTRKVVRNHVKHLQNTNQLSDPTRVAVSASKVAQIRLSNVSFAYRPDCGLTTPVSLTLSRGTPMVITGPSGSGKSTLALILLGLLDPTTGSFSVSYEDDRIENARCKLKVAYASANDFYFEGSIRDNLSPPGSQRSKAELIEIIKSLNLTDWLHSHEQGIESRMDARMLSQGQRSRLSIIRAINSASDLIIFDEVTAPLDQANVDRALKTIRSYLKNKFIIFISHDPEVICKFPERLDIQQG